MDIDVVLKHYMACAVWLLDEDEAQGKSYDASDIADEAVEAMRRDVADFLVNNEVLLDQLPEWYGPDKVGHNFWLTRNGQGTGFWDWGIEEVGDLLTDAGKQYGESDMYIGDDGKLYLT